jgi:hypothetical protein
MAFLKQNRHFMLLILKIDYVSILPIINNDTFILDYFLLHSPTIYASSFFRLALGNLELEAIS